MPVEPSPCQVARLCCIPAEIFEKRMTSELQAEELNACLLEDIVALDTASLQPPELRTEPCAEISERIQQNLIATCEAFNEAADHLEHGALHADEQVKQLLTQFLASDLPAKLVKILIALEFEVRKHVINVFSALWRLDTLLTGDQQIMEYVEGHPHFFQLLIDGYATPAIAMHCGTMLRSCALHERLVQAFLARPGPALQLITFAQNENFDISSDAFSSLHDIMLKHKNVAAAFLETNFADFFELYNSLLQSDDYITQRQALKLLGEMLLNRAFMKVMLSYSGDDRFLRIHMNLLRESSKAIKIEAFHVFKIFAANPNKPPRIQQILYKNKERLVKLLEALQNGSNNRQFDEDRKSVIAKLLALELLTRGFPEISNGGMKVSTDASVESTRVLRKSLSTPAYQPGGAADSCDDETMLQQKRSE